MVLAVSPAAWAHFDPTNYSRSSQRWVGDGTLVDPVTVVFQGVRTFPETHGHSHRTEDLIDFIAGWNPSDSSTQWIGSHSACNTMEREAADGGGDDDRYHVRLNQTWHQDDQGRYTTVGTPHYEEFVDCNNDGDEDDDVDGHAVVPDDPSTSGHDSGFDRGRGRMRSVWTSTYGQDEYVDLEDWMNTRPMGQCNRWVASSAGRVYWLDTDT